jgi:hypothetical protein
VKNGGELLNKIWMASIHQVLTSGASLTRILSRKSGFPMSASGRLVIDFVLRLPYMVSLSLQSHVG